MFAGQHPDLVVATVFLGQRLDEALLSAAQQQRDRALSFLILPKSPCTSVRKSRDASGFESRVASPQSLPGSSEKKPRRCRSKGAERHATSGRIVWPAQLSTWP